jgi:hypothetical protein
VQNVVTDSSALSRGEAEDAIDRLIDTGFLKFVAETRKSEVVLSAPKIVLVPGHDASVKVASKERSLEIAIRSVAEEKPIKYVVEVKLIRDPEPKEPVVLAAPKILLHEGTRGTVRIEGTVMLQMEATVTPVK